MDATIEKRFTNVSGSKTFNHIIDKYRLDSKSVLDIGCSYGEFLKHFGQGSVGLTIIEEEAEVGKNLGLDIRVINIEDENVFLGNKFDVIFANNILEHMQSPHNFLIKIKDYLNPEGLLILGVPCIPYLTPLVRFRKFHGALASLHINFFTRSTLIQSVQFAGWKIGEVRGFRFSNHFIDYLFNLIYPHLYVAAHVDHDFEYPAKRLKELEGYNKNKEHE